MKQRISIAGCAWSLLALAGCSSEMDELQQKVAEIKGRPGERIEPLPEIKPYESFTYAASSLRSPFIPSAPARNDVANAVRPGRQSARASFSSSSRSTR